MELKDFIAETIAQISLGLVEAQERTKEHGTVINPPVHGSPNALKSSTAFMTDHLIQSVDFDICVSVEENKNTDKKGVVEVVTGLFNLGAGCKKSENEKNQEVNRIKFSIPILWGIHTHTKNQ